MLRAAIYLALASLGCDVASAAPGEPAPPPSASAAAVEPARACGSTEASTPLDGRDDAAMRACRYAVAFSPRRACGSSPPFDLAALGAGAPALDDATRAHVHAVADRGRALGRSPRSFALVGDSLTVAEPFLTDLGEGGAAPRLAPEVARALAVDGGKTILDVFRGAPVERRKGVALDAFRATRAAKIGARAAWAVDGGDRSALALTVDRLSPAYAVVLFGTNDSAFIIAPPADVAARFEKDLVRIVDLLEARGVVPILSTLPRHVFARHEHACDRGGGEMSAWRLTVQTNAVSAAVARLACERHLPLVDLRRALDTLPDAGVGPDGIHLTVPPCGSAIDAATLACGYGVREYVTLKVLADVRRAID